MKFKHEFHWALVLTLTSACWLLIAWFSGLHSHRIDLHMLLGNMWVVPAAVVIWFSIKTLRDKVNDGYLSYWNGVQSGTLVAAIALPMHLILYSLYYLTIGSVFFDSAIAFSLEIGMDPVDAGVFFSLPSLLIRETFSIIAAGFIISLFVSMFLKKQDDDFDDE
jgi:hypothetical protein